MAAPWARAWMIDQQEQRRLKTTGFEMALLVFMAIALFFILGVQIGLKEGRADGIKIGEAGVWARHYDQFAKVQWVFEEADLRRMYERR